MKPLTLSELVAAWRAAKAAEAAAQAERLRIEEAIVNMVPRKDEGTVTVENVSVNFKVTRSVDTEALRQAWSALPASAQSLFRWKAEIDTKAMRAAQEFAPDAYKAAAQFITAKPAKPSITIKE